MKKKLLALALMAVLPLAGCNQPAAPSGGGEGGGGSGGDTYVKTTLETNIINFLSNKGGNKVTGLEKIEPLHFITDNQVLNTEQEDDYYTGLDGERYVPYFSAQISGDIVDLIIEEFTKFSWTVPSTPDAEYGYECIDSTGKIEMDVVFDDGTDVQEDEGTWISVYAYADFGGGGGGGGSETGIDIGDSLTVTFSELGLENGEQYTLFTGTKIYIMFGEGENDGKYYNTGTGIRIYGDGWVEVGTIDETQMIASVKFTWHSSNKPSDDVATPSGYNASTGVWSGNESFVDLTRPSGSGHWRLQKIEVTLA